MSAFIDDIKYNLRKSDTLQKLIIINVVVFVIINLSRVIFQLFNIHFSGFDILINQLSVPSSFYLLIRQPWSLITYSFLHEEFLHILFNMLWLYWMGKILVEYLGNKKLLSTYILGAIAGAALYIICFNIFPLFSNIVDYSHALGASASVLAITIAVATLLPDYTIFLLFLGPVRMKYIAAFTILLDLLSMSGSNAGGHIAHLGGALFGFIYIKQLQKGNDLAGWFHNLTDFVSGGFKMKPKMKVAYKKTDVRKSSGSKSEADQETVDRILDKISKSGYTSLTKDEKDLLFKASKGK
jgi:membrane associated rhomboid family serine protease